MKRFIIQTNEEKKNNVEMNHLKIMILDIHGRNSKG